MSVNTYKLNGYPSIFMFKSEFGMAILLLYVNDITLTASSQVLLQAFLYQFKCSLQWMTWQLVFFPRYSSHKKIKDSFWTNQTMPLTYYKGDYLSPRSLSPLRVNLKANYLAYSWSNFVHELSWCSAISCPH